MGPIRILLVDDHHIVRQGIRALLELEKDLEVVGEAANGEKALELVEKLDPDVVLLDVKMPGMGGVEVCRQALARHPELPILILTAFSDDESVLQCIRAGAKGYVLKDVDVVRLVRVIRALHRGESVLDPKVTGVVMHELRRIPRKDEDEATFNEREIEIAKLMAQGLTNKEIGQRLFLSTSAVKFHIHNIMQKLGVTSRVAVIYELSKRGLI